MLAFPEADEDMEVDRSPNETHESETAPVEAGEREHVRPMEQAQETEEAREMEQPEEMDQPEEMEQPKEIELVQPKEIFKPVRRYALREKSPNVHHMRRSESPMVIDRPGSPSAQLETPDVDTEMATEIKDAEVPARVSSNRQESSPVSPQSPPAIPHHTARVSPAPIGDIESHNLSPLQQPLYSYGSSSEAGNEPLQGISPTSTLILTPNAATLALPPPHDPTPNPPASERAPMPTPVVNQSDSEPVTESTSDVRLAPPRSPLRSQSSSRRRSMSSDCIVIIPEPSQKRPLDRSESGDQRQMKRVKVLSRSGSGSESDFELNANERKSKVRSSSKPRAKRKSGNRASLPATPNTPTAPLSSHRSVRNRTPPASSAEWLTAIKDLSSTTNATGIDDLSAHEAIISRAEDMSIRLTSEHLFALGFQNTYMFAEGYDPESPAFEQYWRDPARIRQYKQLRPVPDRVVDRIIEFLAIGHVFATSPEVIKRHFLLGPAGRVLRSGVSTLVYLLKMGPGPPKDRIGHPSYTALLTKLDEYIAADPTEPSALKTAQLALSRFYLT